MQETQTLSDILLCRKAVQQEVKEVDADQEQIKEEDETDAKEEKKKVKNRKKGRGMQHVY